LFDRKGVLVHQAAATDIPLGKTFEANKTAIFYMLIGTRWKPKLLTKRK
jgi:hypothetical protein